MNRVVAALPLGLVLLVCVTASVAQSPGVRSYGELVPYFNGGTWFPGPELFAEQSYFHTVSPNLGPQRAEQRIAFGAYARQGGVEQPAVASVAQPAPYPDTSPELRATAAMLGAILSAPDEFPAALMRFYLAIPNLDVVAGSARRPDGTFEARLYAVDPGEPPGKPVSLKAMLDLTPGSVASEEVSDFQFRRLPTTSSGAVPSAYLATSRKVSDDCHEPVVSKVGIAPDLLAVFSLRYQSDALAAFPQCHTRSIRIKPSSTSPWPTIESEWDRLFAGIRCRDSASAPEAICLYKLVDGMTHMTLDLGFGGGDGQAIVRNPSGGDLRYWDHALGPDGRITVSAGLGNAQGVYIPILFRLNADGSGDPTFGTNGVLSVPATGISTNPRTLTIDYNYNYQLTGETYTANSVRPFAYFYTKAQVTSGAYEGKYVEYDFAGHSNSGFFAHHRHPDGTITAAGATYGSYPDTSTMRPFAAQIAGPAAALPAVQYYHDAYKTYVSVANPDEARKLDRGEFPGWSRTGSFFHVLPLGTAGAFGVERFYSEGFDISSHFFPATAAEAAAVRLNQDWRLEGMVFGAWQPNAEGKCPPSLRGVSRVFRVVSNLPNHWYGQDRSAVDEQVAQGGVLEGFGAKGIVYCAE